jgi:anaerobic selenocysteine-containing dehydrogenase
VDAKHVRTCHLCEANCGLVLEVSDGEVVRVSGDPDNPLSRGYICPKATAIVDIQHDPDRLRRPVRRCGDDWVEIGWEQAYAEIAAKVAGIQAASGTVTTYIGNPAAHNYSGLTQIPLLKASLGMPPTFSAATIDQMPNMVVQLMMYGHNFLYAVPDIDRTEFVLVIGANPLASNGSLWTAPGLGKRFQTLRARGGKLVTVDPRRTETAAVADEHIFIRPGTDAAFLAALLLALDDAGLVNPGRLTPWLDGWSEIWTALRGFDAEVLANTCAIPLDRIRRLAREFAQASAAIAYGRMGTSVQSFGAVCQWLINLLNIATGNLDRVGGVIFGSPPLDIVSLTPGGAYDRFRSRVSGYPETLNEFPVAALAEEILVPGDSQVRGLITYAGNPVLSTPNGRQLDTALEALELLVSVDLYINETTRHAHYILPPCGPLQKDHYPWYLGPMMVRSFACYSPALFPIGEGERSDWEILQGLALHIAEATGRHLAPAREPRAILDQALRSSPRGFTLEEVEAHPHGWDLGPLEPSLPDRLKIPDKRICCAPAPLMNDFARLRDSLSRARTGALKLIGRRQVRNNNSWMHNSRRLAKGPARCTLLMHPADAASRGLATGDVAEVASAAGRVLAPVEVTTDMMRGVVSLPHGFGHGRPGVRLEVARTLQPGVSFNDLTNSQAIDVVSGNAAVNGIEVEVRAVPSAAAREPDLAHAASGGA